MVAVIFLASLVAGSICFGAGLLALMANPKSTAALVFLLAMWGAFVSLITGTMYPLMGAEDHYLKTTVGVTFAFAALLSQTFLWQLTILFPVKRRITFRPLNRYGLVVIAGIVAAVTLASSSSVDRATTGGWAVILLQDRDMGGLYAAATVLIAMIFIVSSRKVSNRTQRRSGVIYLAGLWIFVLSGIPSILETVDPWMIGDVSIPDLSLVVGIAMSGLLFSLAIARGHMQLREPVAEVKTSSSKATCNLIHRRIYLVEEEKPVLSLGMFVDTLRGRCYDCEDDESFPCESLDCSTCRLPCPCRECSKYASRAQGLLVTRQHPQEIRSKFYLQTTPIIWLSTVAGEDNLDPAKLSLLTDMIVNFMERSQNGVVLVEGIEYMVTSNDFPRILKVVDVWAETAMASATRLIISVDPRAFDSREMALLESGKEIVKSEELEALLDT